MKAFSGKVSKFIQKLLLILQDQQYRSAIRWTDDGTGILITSRKNLENLILNDHFKLKKINSFIRQLHLYSFYKRKNTGKQLIFENPYFTRDDRNSYSHIQRKYKEKTEKSDENISSEQQKPQQLQEGTEDPNPTYIIHGSLSFKSLEQVFRSEDESEEKQVKKNQHDDLFKYCEEDSFLENCFC